MKTLREIIKWTETKINAIFFSDVVEFIVTALVKLVKKLSIDSNARRAHGYCLRLIERAVVKCSL